MKAVVAAFNQEKALVGAFSVITNLRMELFEALTDNLTPPCTEWPRMRWRFGWSLVGNLISSCVVFGKNKIRLLKIP